MKKLSSIIVAILIAGTAFCQSPASLILGKNVIKFNLTSTALEHYMFQYERALGLNRSIGIGIGYSHGADLPFKNYLLDQWGDNQDAKDAINSTKMDKLTITPEYRFYFGIKGAPIGFYLSTFVRYTDLTMHQTYPFTPSNGVPHTADITGTLSGVGGGAMIGMQWALGKAITLDWWIVGPFIGVQNGKFSGTSDMSDMTEADKTKLISDIENTNIPLWTIDATITGNNIDAVINGPFYGVRMFGLCLGYRF